MRAAVPGQHIAVIIPRAAQSHLHAPRNPQRLRSGSVKCKLLSQIPAARCFDGLAVPVCKLVGVLSWRGCPRQVLELVQQCWAQDPAQRPKMAEVCRHLEGLLADVRERIRQDKARK